MTKRKLAYLLIGSGIILGGVSLALWLSRPEPPAPNSPGPSQAQPAVTHPNKSDISSYLVAPDQPRYIIIPAINVPTTRVRPLGLIENNRVAVPSNIYDAGWYTGSAKPGQPGAVFIYGHISSWQAKGVFYDLHKLQAGDIINITRGDGKKYSYQVVSTRVYSHDHVDMRSVLSPVDSGVPGLNLMTCTGKVIKRTSEFSERLVVFSRQISAE
jgi:LPXTG-site transpeptidase (sortase) family protein